ncbi:transthyretin-like family protein [Corallococcus sp. M7]
MSLRRNLLTIAVLSSALLSACALRPRYNEVIQANGATGLQEGQLVVLRVTDAATGKPVKGAKVLGGEYRNHINATTDENGEFSLPIDPGLVKENPLVEVVLPKGVSRYKLQVVPSGQAPAPEGAPIAPPAESSAAEPSATEPSTTPATPGAPSETSAPAASETAK